MVRAIGTEQQSRSRPQPGLGSISGCVCSSRIDRLAIICLTQVVKGAASLIDVFPEGRPQRKDGALPQPAAIGESAASPSVLSELLWEEALVARFVAEERVPPTKFSLRGAALSRLCLSC